MSGIEKKAVPVLDESEGKLLLSASLRGVCMLLGMFAVTVFDR